MPLKGVDITVLIQGFVARIQAALTYKNVESCPIEAKFTFPMDEGSAVYKFEAEIENRLVVGECQEKQQVRILLYCETTSLANQRWVFLNRWHYHF